MIRCSGKAGGLEGGVVDAVIATSEEDDRRESGLAVEAVVVTSEGDGGLAEGLTVVHTRLDHRSG